MYLALTLQSMRKLKIHQKNATGVKMDWWEACRRLYNNEIWLAKIPLNEHNFETLLNYEITEEMSKTDFKELDKFEIELWE